jgi:Spy/CpxP family protein refolding chaperone
MNRPKKFLVACATAVGVIAVGAAPALAGGPTSAAHGGPLHTVLSSDHHGAAPPLDDRQVS